MMPTRLVLGVDALASWQLDPSMQLTANAGVGYDFLADKSHISASYVGFDGIVFVTPNIEPHEWVYRGGVGFEAAATDQLDIYINYEYQGRKDFDNHLLVGTLRYAF